MIAAQHQDGARHGVDEELEGGVDAAVVAPDADQEVHGHQADFPEDVEEEEVLRQEDADQAEFQQQQEGVKFLAAILDGVPGNQHAERGEEGGEQDQPQADAVHRNREVNVGRADPGHVDQELLARGIAVEPGQQAERRDEGGERADQRPHAAALRGRRARNRQGDEECGQRHDEDQGEEVHRGRPPNRPMARIRATEPNSTQVA